MAENHPDPDERDTEERDVEERDAEERDAEERDTEETVPLPTDETEAEHERIRSSNDLDQRLEREGKIAPHNRGYDEAADGPPTPIIESVVDE